MAVVQISRIQVRRGRKNQGTGLPQLASGEIAWAIDTQELYIGNGAVSEGAPEVNNTKILTEHDNLLDLAGQYEYKSNDTSIVTGTDPNYPIIRSLQDRLDESVTVFSFGVTGDGVTDDTATLQNAIDQLFMTTTARNNSATRTVLHIPAGTYKITDTLYIPSFATLVGEGVDKTVINYIGSGVPIVFVNDSSRPGNIDPDVTNETNQPTHIQLSNLTINSQTANTAVMQLNSVIDSVFENLKLTGQWSQVVVTSSSGGINFDAKTSLVTCERNRFSNVTVSGFTYGVYAAKDINNNEFINLRVVDCYQGFRLGKGIDGIHSGQLYGPRNTLIANCLFETIKRQAVYIDNGTGNTVTHCRFKNVGNNGGNNVAATYTQVYFAVVGNTVNNNQSDRQADLSANNFSVPYIGEQGGKVEFQSFGVNTVQIGPMSVASSPLFRIPINGTVTGYKIKYTYQGNGRSREGVISIAVDVPNNRVQLSDEYNYVGSNTDLTALNFKARITSLATSKDTLEILYTNTASSDNGATLTYSYSAVQ